MKDPLTNLTIYLAGDFGPGLPHSKLKTFISHNGGSNADKVSSATTHIVCSPNLSAAGASDLVSQIKHCAIVKKCKMVTYDWLEDSLQSKKKLAERTYLYDMKLRQREARIEEGRKKLVARHQEKERVMALKAKMKKEEEQKRREQKVVKRREGVLWGWVVGENEEQEEERKEVKVKRGRGRPRKVKVEQESEDVDGRECEKEKEKRPRGRPRKTVVEVAQEIAKKKPGRPRKN